MSGFGIFAEEGIGFDPAPYSLKADLFAHVTYSATAGGDSVSWAAPDESVATPDFSAITADPIASWYLIED